MAKYKYLTFQDREELARQYAAGSRVADIAASLGVHPATIYHDLARGRTEQMDENMRPIYDPVKAQQVVRDGFSRRGHR